MAAQLSNSESNTTKSGGIGIGTILFIVFLVLKLCNVIDWSWWWVTSPLWIPIIVVFAIPFCIVFFVMLALLFKKLFR